MNIGIALISPPPTASVKILAVITRQARNSSQSKLHGHTVTMMPYSIDTFQINLNTNYSLHKGQEEVSSQDSPTI